jgi:hypothetical protein
VFNLVVIIFNLLIAIALIIRWALSLTRSERKSRRVTTTNFAELWGLAEKRDTRDRSRVTVSAPAMLASDADVCANHNRALALSSLIFTDVCALLTVCGIVIFFVFERLDTLMVVFDYLSPLFGALFILVVLAMILSITRTEKDDALEHSGAIYDRWGVSEEGIQEKDGKAENSWMEK